MLGSARTPPGSSRRTSRGPGGAGTRTGLRGTSWTRRCKNGPCAAAVGEGRDLVRPRHSDSDATRTLRVGRDSDDPPGGEGRAFPPPSRACKGRGSPRSLSTRSVAKKRGLPQRLGLQKETWPSSDPRPAGGTWAEGTCHCAHNTRRRGARICAGLGGTPSSSRPGSGNPGRTARSSAASEPRPGRGVPRTRIVTAWRAGPGRARVGDFCSASGSWPAPSAGTARGGASVCVQHGRGTRPAFASRPGGPAPP
jgi:hypothetical protein